MAAKRKSSRRQFLTGQAALDAVSAILPDAPATQRARADDATKLAAETSAGSSSLQDRGAYLIQIDRTAMACEFQILLNAGQHAGSTEAALDALDLLETLEDQMSWFRGHSELSQINRRAAERPVAVETRLFGLLRQAVELHQQTAGAFDITTGPLWKLWGFHRREGKIPDEPAIAEALELVGTDRILLDPESSTIQFQRDALEINLGAIGKGYALDRCAELMLSRGVENFMIHGGRSSILARGAREGHESSPQGWTIALRHPLRHELPLAEIDVRDRALGTSGSGNQFFHFGGQRYGHVLDPRNGWPATGILSATVLAPTAAEADALATACFVMGVEASVEFVRARPELALLLAIPGERSGTIELVVSGLTADQWRRVN